MKKLKLYFIVAAVLLGAAASFAFQGNDNMLIVAVAANQATCERVGTCSDVGEMNCKTNDNIPLFVRISSTSCSMRAKGDFVPDGLP